MGKFLSIIWRIIGILSVVVITCFIWLYFFVPKPQTISTSYINSLTALDKENVALEDSTIVLDIQLLKNKDNSGQKLFEMAFTTYQGTNYNEKYTKGVQVIGDMETSIYRSYSTTKWKKWIFSTKNIWYDIAINNLYSYDISYDKGEGVAFASPSPLNNTDGLIISVGDSSDFKLAELKFKNEIADTSSKYYLGKGYETSSLIGYDDKYILCGLNYFIESMYNSASSFDAGTYYITVDLSEFFDIYLQNENGQFVIRTQDEKFVYVTLRINVEDSGILTRSQSMFGMVAQNDGSVRFEIDQSPSLFWKAYENVTIEDCLNTRYSNYYNGNLLYINEDIITKLKDYKNLRIHLIIDLSKYENIIGIDSFGLDGLNYYDITIIGSTQDFYFMSNSLVNTKVGTIYHSNDINIVVYDSVDINLQVVA